MTIMRRRPISPAYASCLTAPRFESAVIRAGVDALWCKQGITKTSVAYRLRADNMRRCRIIFENTAVPVVALGAHEVSIGELAAEPLSLWRTHVVARRGGHPFDAQFLEALGRVLPLWSRVPST